MGPLVLGLLPHAYLFAIPQDWSWSECTPFTLSRPNGTSTLNLLYTDRKKHFLNPYCERVPCRTRPLLPAVNESIWFMMGS